MNKIILTCLLGISFACGNSEPKIFGPGFDSNSIINGTPTGSLPEHAAVVSLHRLEKRANQVVRVSPY